MHGDHSQSRLEQAVHDDTGGTLDTDRKLVVPQQAFAEQLQARLVMRRDEAFEDPASLVDHAHGMFLARPIQTSEVHRQGPPRNATMLSAGGSGGLLIDRRSTRSETAATQRPVAHLTLRHPLCGGSHAGRRAASLPGRHSGLTRASTARSFTPAEFMVHQ